MTTWVDPNGPAFAYADMCNDLAIVYALLQQYIGQAPVNLAAYVPGFQVTTDGTGLAVYVNSRLQTTVAIPVGGRFIGPYVVGAGLVASNIVTNAGSAYIATTAFTATTFAADLAAGKLRTFASAGAPAVNRTGAYLATQTYNVGDGVTTTTGVAVGTGQVNVVSQWVLSVAAPAGTAPAYGSAYWSLIAGPSVIDTTLVNDTVNGYGLLSTYLATLTTKVAAALAAGVLAQRQTSQINVQLGKASVTGFPLTLATS